MIKYFKAIRVRHTSATTTHANTRVTEGKSHRTSGRQTAVTSVLTRRDGQTPKLLFVRAQTNAIRTHYEARDHSPKDGPFIAPPFSCQYVALDTFERKSHARSACLPARVSSARLPFFTCPVVRPQSSCPRCPLCIGSTSAKNSHRRSRRTTVRTWRPA